MQVRLCIIDVVMALSVIVFFILMSRNYSYLSDGKWENATSENCKLYSYCARQSNLVWSSPAFIKTYNEWSFCKMMREREFRNIIFVGDSQSRHVAQGLFLIASGDHMHGGMRVRNRKCAGDLQFSENKCGPGAFATTIKTFCNREVTVKHYWPENFYKALVWRVITSLRDTVLVWSEGSHYTRPMDSYGMYNFVAYRDKLFDGAGNGLHALCGPSPTIYNRKHVMWMSVHARPAETSSRTQDETHSKVAQYNAQMRKFFESKQCGKVGFLDVWNMTLRFVQEHADLVPFNSYDSYHYTIPVNILKAQLVLNHIVINNFNGTEILRYH